MKPTLQQEKALHTAMRRKVADMGCQQEVFRPWYMQTIIADTGRRKMKRFKTIIAVVIIAAMLCACGREVNQVSHNISVQADNFNVMRRITVFNTRTDKCLLQMTGRFSLQNEGANELAVIVEIDRKKGRYQKHFIYLNEWVTYTVEDLNGVEVSRYDYELEFMPQMLVPVKIKATEIGQDFVEATEETE